MNDSRQDLAALVGRVLLALLFFISGLDKLGNYSGTMSYMTSAGLPMPQVLLVLTILIEVGCGLLVLLGLKARWAALIIALFLIPVTIVFHNPWASPADQQQMQMITAMKNLSIMGGLLLLAAFGPGRFSFDRG